MRETADPLLTVELLALIAYDEDNSSKLIKDWDITTVPKFIGTYIPTKYFLASAFDPPIGHFRLHFGPQDLFSMDIRSNMCFSYSRPELQEQLDPLAKGQPYITLADVFYQVGEVMRSTFPIACWGTYNDDQRRAIVSGRSERLSGGMTNPQDQHQHKWTDMRYGRAQLTNYQCRDVLGKKVMFAGLAVVNKPYHWKLITKER